MTGDTIQEMVYILCGLTSVLCAALLFRRYQHSRTKLLFWSTGCFAGLALTNILLYVDLVLLPSVDLALWRGCITLAAMSMLLFGLAKERT